MVDLAGVAVGNRAVREVVEDYGAGADGAPSADFHTLDYGGSGSYPGAFTHMHVTAEGGVGGDMYEILKYTFVIDRSRSVDDAMLADPAVGLYHDPGHHHSTFSDFRRLGNYGERGDRSAEAN